MIVGEAEVQGQVKRAYELALVEGATGPITNRLFREALAAGKRVRTETASAARACRSHRSRSSWPPDMLGDLTNRRVLVIGAGENGELTARALHERGVHTVFVANRHYDRAIGLAQRFGGYRACASRTSRRARPGRHRGQLHRLAAPDRRTARSWSWSAPSAAARPLVLIDIAVPRDIDPSVRDLPGITLYDMDDLQRAVARNPPGARPRPRRRARSSTSEVAALRPLARHPRRGAHHHRPARARRGDRGAGAARERVALGVAVARPTASGCG